MKHKELGTLLIVGGFLCVLASAPATAGIKCWTNKEGVRECGNVVPPEYAQQGHEELSEQGITVKKTAAAKTTEELEAEQEAKRLQAERERLAREQAAKDKVLLDTFTTEDDLILARDGKLAAIDSRIEHTKQIAERLKENLDQLQTEAANQERAGQKVSEELLADIASVERQIQEQMLFVEQRNKEKQELREKFEADLARYRELKGD